MSEVFRSIEIPGLSRISLGLLKPDAIARGLDQEIYTRIKKHGFDIVKQKRIRLPKESVEQIYSSVRNKEFYDDLLGYLTFGPAEPFLVILFNGKDAITELNTLVGHTDPKLSPPGTIRGDLAESTYFKIYPKVCQNLIHTVPSREKLIQDAQVLFPEESKFISLFLGNYKAPKF